MAQDFSVYDDIPGEKREPERVKEHVSSLHKEDFNIHSGA